MMKILFGVAILVWSVSLGGVAEAKRVEVGGALPVVIGNMSQNFNTNFGAMAALYVDPLFSKDVDNFLSVGFDSFGIKADTSSSFRVFPILVGLEVGGKINETFRTTFAAAAGAAFGYLNVINANTYQAYTYGAAQVRGGIEADMGGGFSIFARTPVTFLIKERSMSYVSYLFGLGFKL